MTCRLAIAISVGVFFGAWHAWGWPWWAAVLFAAPGLAFMFLTLPAFFFEKKSGRLMRFFWNLIEPQFFLVPPHLSYQPCEDNHAMITKILNLLSASIRAIDQRNRSASGFASQLEFRF